MKYIFYVLVLFGLGSCAPPMYIPDAVQANTLTDKGELEMRACAGSGGYDLGVGYAITDHIGLQTKASILSESSSSSGDFMNRNYVEFGGGYTNTFAESERTIKGVYSVFGGAGTGSADGRETFTEVILFGSIPDTEINTSNGSFANVWLQPMVGFINPFIEVVFTARINYVNYYDLRNNFSSNPYSLGLDEKHFNVFYEPCVTVKGGGEKIKGMIQLGYSFNHFNQTVVQFRQRRFISNIGIIVDLDLIK